MTLIFGIFLVAHGLVHLLFYAQSGRRFELKPGLTWPDGSWLFSRFLGQAGTRSAGKLLMALAALGLAAAGAGYIARQGWAGPAAAFAASFSSLAFIQLWNGRRENLDAQGGIALLINLGIILVVLYLSSSA